MRLYLQLILIQLLPGKFETYNKFKKKNVFFRTLSKRLRKNKFPTKLKDKKNLSIFF